ncbi:class I SAM-dependent methyltransferase [Asanoa iriomotensis]|uniref:S-adenosyl-L-methionine-dependent methyltransferase n=1 Tax=Asanoa iriomotensis TaxID=234613 RepID=A0ABQ4BWN7_9ACTN|nr:class I SAM-dependent methyltransferase [Asanoa iriomotensis]GIF54932.1 putative S-adenosyl-L-methionine-dependent methyltransferase [Asanoa iriomotensis]
MAEIAGASRTAVLVCQGRAAAHDLVAPDRFADPTALPLLREDERVPVRLVRDGRAPKEWRARVEFETVKAITELMVPRTVAIDDAVRARPLPQVVILGAGLDGRAWRMPELAGTAVFEVDQPASQADKRARAAALTGAPPAYVPVDFRTDDLSAKLAAAGHAGDRPTTWIWEGVVPYLTPAEVEATVGALAACSAPGSRLVVNFQLPVPFLKLGFLVARAVSRSAGRSSVFAREPWRSTWTPKAMADLLARHGYTVVADQNMLDTAEGMPVPVQHRRSLAQSQVQVADRD